MARRRHGTGQTALVTGASGGIGLELARCFAKGGYNLILVARSAEVLGATAAELSKAHDVQVEAVAFDLGVPGAGTTLVQMLNGQGRQIDVLVNNAGFGDIGPFAERDAEKAVAMVDLNVRTLTELTRALLPAMIARKRGGVLNVASVAAFQPGPFMAVYYATKHYVLALSEALWEELRGTGVTVTALCPGPVKTGFQSRADVAEDAKLMTFVPLTTAAFVAQTGYRGFRARRRVVVAGLVNRILVALAPLTPRFIILRLARYLQT